MKIILYTEFLCASVAVSQFFFNQILRCNIVSNEVRNQNMEVKIKFTL